MSRKSRSTGGLVWSSDHGEMCPGCEQPRAACRCSEEEGPPRGDGPIRVRRETKGRKGKGVTLVEGIPLAGKALQELAKELKKKCGSGGTLKDGVLEVQGDHRDRLVELLEAKGYTVRRVG